MSSYPTQTIPVVDLNTWRSGNVDFARQLGEALEEYGFVAVENHGVRASTRQRALDQVKALFALDDQVKLTYERPEHGRQRGFTPCGVERAKDVSVADLKEFWHIGPEFTGEAQLAARIGANVWPAELPEFRRAMLEFYDELHACGLLLFEALAHYLEVPPNTFTDMLVGGNTVLRSIHYPKPETDSSQQGAVWAAAHEDINMMTLLSEATEPGLELLTRDGEWLPIHPVPGQLIADTGDMFQRLTNGRFPATTHRVVAPANQRNARYSMPFFIHPHPDTMLTPIASCAGETNGLRYEALNAHEYLQSRLRANQVLRELSRI